MVRISGVSSYLEFELSRTKCIEKPRERGDSVRVSRSSGYPGFGLPRLYLFNQGIKSLLSSIGERV